MTAAKGSEPEAKSSGNTLKYVLIAFVVLALGCGFFFCAVPGLMLAVAEPEDFEVDEGPVESVEPADEELDEAPEEETKKSGKARKSEKASRGSSRKKKSKGKRKRR